jgi:hypothetical protein
MLGDKIASLCEVLQHRRDGEYVVDACSGCSSEVAKDVTMDESWCDESVYECLGEVRRVVGLYQVVY